MASDINCSVSECIGQAWPLLRKAEAYAATVVNNDLTNVSDADRLDNQLTKEPRGLEAPLELRCGVNGEVTVSGWEAKPTPAKAP